MRKLVPVLCILVLALSMVPLSAQHSNDRGVKKTHTAADLQDVLQKKSPQAQESQKSAEPCTGKWFFLMAGDTAGHSITKVFVVVGPFKDQEDCIELNGWVQKRIAHDVNFWSNSQGTDASRCWYSGD